MQFVTWFLGIILSFFLLAGLVVDSGGKIQTHQHALATAQQAARAATNAAAGRSVDGQAFDLSGPMAATAAQNYLAAAGLSGDVSVAGDTVTVTVSTTYNPVLLSFLGPLPVEATGTAQLIGGQQ